MRRYGLIHVATHGQLVTTSGLFAHLKLADDDLRYDDIVHIGLAGALVVLAACEGAAAEVLPGEEVLSLSRAFLAAGARGDQESGQLFLAPLVWAGMVTVGAGFAPQR